MSHQQQLLPLLRRNVYDSGGHHSPPLPALLAAANLAVVRPTTNAEQTRRVLYARGRCRGRLWARKGLEEGSTCEVSPYESNTAGMGS